MPLRPNPSSSPSPAGRANQSVEPATIGWLTPRDLALVEVIAHRVADLLEARRSPRLVSAQELAATLGVSRAFVYEHAEQLGAVEVGGGTRPRLRFDPDRAVVAWTSRCMSEGSQSSDASVRAGSRRRRRDPMGSGAPLLPVRGAK